MYELEAYEILSSPHYLARLNAPTPWSTRMMPHHRNMVRSQCRVIESIGGGVARLAATVRLSAAEGREQELRSHLTSLLDTICTRPGLVGAHLLQHETPPIAATTEQRIRGMADREADLVLVAVGYDPVALKYLAETELAPDSLMQAGATSQTNGLYSLSHAATPADVLG